MRSLRWLGALVLALGCSQLKFLKPPSVPRPRGSTSLERGPALAAPVLDRVDPDGDWRAYNRTLEGDRGSPLSQIDTGNVARLRPVCRFDLGERVPLESGLVVVAGTMYVTTATRTYAFDAATCALRWR